MVFPMDVQKRSMEARRVVGREKAQIISLVTIFGSLFIGIMAITYLTPMGIPWYIPIGIQLFITVTVGILIIRIYLNPLLSIIIFEIWMLGKR
jgi:hypothetical protein